MVVVVGLGLRKSAVYVGSSLISLVYVSTSKSPSGSAGELTALSCSRLQRVYVYIYMAGNLLLVVLSA